MGGEKNPESTESMAVHYSPDSRRVKTNVAGRRKWGWCLELSQSPEQYHPPPLYPIRQGRRTTFQPSPARGHLKARKHGGNTSHRTSPSHIKTQTKCSTVLTKEKQLTFVSKSYHRSPIHPSIPSLARAILASSLLPSRSLFKKLPQRSHREVFNPPSTHFPYFPTIMTRSLSNMPTKNSKHKANGYSVSRSATCSQQISINQSIETPS